VDDQPVGVSNCADEFAKPETLDTAWQSRDWRKVMPVQKFIIERDIPKVGTFEREQLRGAASKSNEVLRQLGPDIQWVESYVADNKTFCVYLARDEAIIREHAKISGFPANKITAVNKMIDPTTENS
jgi:Nickel responsive protein SCO4226-like